jgi:ferredoxin
MSFQFWCDLLEVMCVVVSVCLTMLPKAFTLSKEGITLTEVSLCGNWAP